MHYAVRRYKGHLQARYRLAQRTTSEVRVFVWGQIREGAVRAVLSQRHNYRAALIWINNLTEDFDTE